MFKKTLLMMLFVACMAPWAVKADELTVCNGEVLNKYVPVYGDWANKPLKCEFIIPATELGDLTGGTISKMTFYSSSANVSWGDAIRFDVFVKEVNTTTLSDFTGQDGSTTVYQGLLSISNNIMEVPFSNSTYNYGGGNLLVGLYTTTSGSYVDASFYGVSASGASYSGYEGYTSWQVEQRDFLPKTTFTYTPDPTACPKPNSFAAATTVGSTSVSLSWNANGGSAWDLAISETELADPTTAATYEQERNTTSYNFNGTLEHTYYAYVRGNCGSGNTSSWATCSFTPTAVQTLTVNDGSSTANKYVPFNYATALYNTIKSQFIIPSATLNGMVWGEIQKLAFYRSTEYNENFGNSNFTVYISEVENTALSSSFVDWANLTECYRGTVSINNGVVTVDLDTPYQYKGGNMLIGFYLNSLGSSSGSSYNYWIGTTGTASCARWCSTSTTEFSGTYQPKTTFSFLPYETGDLIIDDATNITAGSAQVNWTGGGYPPFTVQYRKNGDTDWITAGETTQKQFVINGLDAETTYDIQVKASADVTYTTVNNYFETLECSDPEDLATSQVTYNSYTLSWTAGNSAAWVLQYGTNSSFTSGTYTEVNSNTAFYTIENLAESTTYYARVKASCSDGDGWQLFSSFVTGALPAIEVTSDSPFPTETFGNSSSHGFVNCPDGFSWTNNGWTITYPSSSSDYMAYTEYCSSSTVKTMITPFMKLNGFGTLSFKERVSGSSSSYKVPTLEVYVSIDGENPTGSAIYWSQPNSAITTKTERTADLSAYYGQKICLIFKYTANANSSSSKGWYVDDVSVTVTTTTTFNGTVDSDWNTAGNWNHGVPTSALTAVINAPCTIANETIAEADEITIGGSGSLTIAEGGQLICSNSVAVTMQKSTEASTAETEVDEAVNNWYLISSPVNNVAVSSFAQGTHNVYSFNEPTHYWIEYHNWGGEPSTATLTNGLGYLYRSTTANVAFTGSSNASTVKQTLTYTTASGDLKGFNLIGNPYTHNIYKGVAITGDDLEEKYCILNTNGTWSLTEDNVAIAPMQAVLVEVTSETEITIAKNAAAPVGKYGNDNIWFTVKNNEFTDVACVEFKEGHGFNKPEHRNENAPMLYIINNGERFASACMPDNTSVINLGFETKTMGEYTISLKAEGQYSYMHLIDKLTGEDIDMLVEDSYTFIGSQNDRKDRFMLNLNYNAAGIDSESDIFAYQSGSDIIVSGEGELQVFDITGRKVMTTNINGVETINGMNTGVYILKLNGKAQKIVIR